eukprot:TRINITY_DN2858_c0_g1_i3.p1 TRINITY_DN2858_c0_g1~~TRINITY_DN2858_c0_g1_i3.p1  ORF type:complete len:305 (+),score=21.18 TRINITY_DN2858_c0_g1_i3:1100-2014(+)
MICTQQTCAEWDGMHSLFLIKAVGILIIINSSGRPEFPAKTQADTEKYLLEGLDKWRQQMGIKKFILCGHSLGGYVATKYAHNNPDKVMALMLISPAGMWPIPSNFHKEMEGFLKTIGCIKRNIFKKASAYWAPGKSPLQLLRNFGRSSIFVLKSYVNWFPALQEQEKADMKEYLFHILMKPGTGELAMPYLLHPVYYAKSKEFEQGAYGVNPLAKTLNELKIPVSVFFGTRDWMASRTPSGANLDENPHIKQRMIEDASHHIYLDKPDELINAILEDLSAIPGATSILPSIPIGPAKLIQIEQ